MSDTPRTDAAYSASTSVGIYELFSSAQQMERELNATNARIAALEAHVARLEGAGSELLNILLMPEDSMPYSDWVDAVSDSKRKWWAAKEAKP